MGVIHIQINEFNWLDHFEELRGRLIKTLIVISVIFLIFLYFANDIFHLVALPLIKKLPHNNKLIATTVTGPFAVPIKLAFYSALMVTAPFISYQLWKFVAPGLYLQEKYLLWPIAFISIILFYLGGLFAYSIILPIFFRFLILITPPDIVIMADINAYLSFILRLIILFGLIFEIPMLILMLNLMNIVDYQKLKSIRPYLIISAFVIGMLLAPPDVISQILIAIPICLLYEVGLLMVRLFSLYFNKIATAKE